MCKSSEHKDCQNPEECKDHPEKCSPEQIKKCHGDASEHPCVKDADKK